MARKNGNGEGSRPRQRSDGRWEARYWAGGKRRSVYGSTRKEAADRLARAVANGEEPQGTSPAPGVTVRDFFAQYDDAVRDTMKDAAWKPTATSRGCTCSQRSETRRSKT